MPALPKLSLVLVLAVSVPAPGAAEVDPGTRVRVTILALSPAESLAGRGFEPGDRIVGTLLAAGPRGLELRRDGDLGDTLAIPRPLVAGFETSTGRRTQMGQGAALGLVLGCMTGVAIGLLDDPTFSLGFGPRTDGTFVYGFAGAVGGLTLGAIVGSRFHRDRWRPAEPPAGP